MMNNPKPISEFLVPGKRAHLVGIGGVSMCPLAEVLAGKGLLVQGSDMTESDSVKHLRSKGISVAIGHNAENLGDCDFVIRTAAVHDGNPEIAGAIARGIPVYERAQAWGAIMQHYENALCISGTHGKTTTTSMATHIFMAAQADPTVMIGGTLPMLHAGYRVGKGNTIILESCEYCNSFLNFFPTVAVILNVGEDHLDFFKDLADIERSFHAFADLVPQRGYVIANADDQGARDAVAGLSHPVFTFSLADRTADCYARDVAFFDGCASFDVMWTCTFPASTTFSTPWRRPRRPMCWGSPARPSPWAWRISTGPDAGSSTRAAITGRRCMTTMPTTRRSFTPC